MDFRTRLKKLREEKSLTHKDIAVFLGVNYNTVGNYERGTRQPDLETTNKIADYFDVSVDYLIGRTNERSLKKAADYSSLSKRHQKMIKTYDEFAESDDPHLRKLADSIAHMLGLDEHEDE